MKIIMYNNQSNGPGPQRATLGCFGWWLLLIFVVPAIELYLLIQVGQYLGAFETVALVIVTGVVGGFLMKFEGMRVWQQFMTDIRSMKMPKDGVLDALLILVGGIVLIFPGLITDVLGLLMLIPFTRHITRDIIKARLQKRSSGSDSVIDV